MKFYVEGTMNLGSETRKFSKEIDAVNENVARERVYTLLGATCGVKRPKIAIEKIEKA